MTELLALPSWNADPRTLADWASAFSSRGLAGKATRDAEGLWIAVPQLDVRGYLVLEGERVTAINFELSAPDPEPARNVLEDICRDLGWELTEEGDDEQGDDDDEED